MKTPNGQTASWPAPAAPDMRRSVVAPDLVVEGEMTSAGPVDVQGTVVGGVEAPEVVVAEAGRIEGSVTAHDLAVLGRISGSVSARQVRLGPSAVVQAHVLHERIAIEAGAELDGRLQRKA
ncbi:Polymer-forming protein [[Luteovulum] sphaeroides subsp. megalophilum]|uniref:bactofilin family protein n=1 Tax=Cereibacter sphaeroides TaxID=1063 RepID=UPI000191CADA|nr:polymer-forming cytoskeletal protein [Cereibacter sphaeroides]ACM04226.1 Hypothetical Protein RSKD131_4366 [Cereibacter sphaeroides KD131]SNT26808.1 Polymer-forming protein [[Luteovulum] sphaeroides subsp. megalophilum]